MKMSENSTLNFLIHDANGQPQMVKVVQNTSTNPIKVKPNPIKLIKLPGEGNNQTPVFRAVQLNDFKASKILPVPVEPLPSPEKTIAKTEPVNVEEAVAEEEQRKISEAQLEETVAQFVSRAKLEKASPSPRSSLRNYNKTTGTMSQRRRHDSDNDPPAEYTTKRRKHADKVGKGLRHFSMKVCEKVRNKGFTSYNEVADELVLEFSNGVHGSPDGQQYDQKNIRRRVYDALNVLMAMNIISKDKKEIRWIGLPTNSVQECTALEKEKQSKLERIQKKTQQLQELIMQHISFKSLIERNKEAESRGVKPSPSSAIHLPFIVVNTSDKALIDCSISNDKTEYMFNFNKRFQIHDDIDILKRMGLLYGLDKGECTEEDMVKVKSMVPKSLENFVEQMGKGVSSKLTAIVKEEVGEEDEDDDELVDGEDEDGEGEGDTEALEFSDDSSDVDV